MSSYLCVYMLVILVVFLFLRIDNNYVYFKPDVYVYNGR